MRFRHSLLLLTGLTVAASLRAETCLRFCLRTEPRTFHPLLVADESSETIRYLTGGVLVRLNRRTQQLQPGLARTWNVSEGGRRIDFDLRPAVTFSDGTPFNAADVVYTVHELLRPDLHAPTADSFKSGEGVVDAKALSDTSVSVRFPKPISGLAELFDQVPMLSSRSPLKEKAVLGPYQVAEYKPGQSILLRRNTHYWEKDSRGHQLPYIDSVKLDIQQNREGEALRFERGEIDLVQKLEPETFDRLTKDNHNRVLEDGGPSLDSELVWFNMAPDSPIPAFKKVWFADRHFRRGLSMAINRDEICRIVYRGHAIPASGPVSPSNKFWYNDRLPARTVSASDALKELALSGFHQHNGVLRDHSGNPVEFSLITNAGNKNHERMLALMQQQFGRVGVHLNVVTLDFSSILERIMRTYNYESCLMALTNVGLDPNEQMNVWLSSASNHQWNPNQKKPATDWEAKIDELMKAQASSSDQRARKKLFDEVQAIARDQEPFVYLIHPNYLGVISRRIRDHETASLQPQLLWDIERERLDDASR